ncbi:putative EF-hand domain-containing protein [Helianthus annuus]|nr:putative EF-hand domain-containing protein [Helianthus annuus]
MSSYGSSTKPTSPGSSFTRFFRRLLSSPSTKPPSFSAPISCNSDEIHQVFNYFDENGDGMISATELQNRLRKVGGEEVQLSDKEVEMSDEEAEEAEEGGRGGGSDGWLSFVLID